MRSTALTLALCVLLALACRSPEPDAPRAVAESLRAARGGEVVGTDGLHGGHAWLGVPFAQAPLGALRWRAPQPPEPWEGRREALRSGPRCPQFGSSLDGGGAGELIGDEDCLTLNIYAPAFAADAVPTGNARLPVLFWIHGGGNTIGTASFYDGSQLASTHDVVVVMVNYRLGPLGWLRHAALREGASPEEQSGNFGNLDHIGALAWVRDNIEAFGGDPGNVTIFGESAGGHDVLALLVSPAAEGLFHRAIAQSAGTGFDTPARAENFVDAPEPGDPHSSNETLVRLLKRRGLAGDREVAKARLGGMSNAEIAALLRETESKDLFALYVEDADEPGLGMIDHPRVFGDGTVLPVGDLHDVVASGAYHRVPVILGTNRDENKLFLYTDPVHVRMILGVLPRLRDPERYEAVASAMSRAWKANSVDDLAKRMRRIQGDSVYAYRFDWDEEPSVLGADLSRMLGAAHAFEIPFVFGHWDLGPEGSMLFDDENEPGRLVLSEAMMSYWAEFAYRGDPGRGRDGTLPAWEAWGAVPSPEKFLVLDTAADGGIRMAADTVSLAEVAAEFQSDERLDDEARCAAAEDLVRWFPRIEPELGAAGGAQLACASAPGVAAGGE